MKAPTAVRAAKRATRINLRVLPDEVVNGTNPPCERHSPINEGNGRIECPGKSVNKYFFRLTCVIKKGGPQAALMFLFHPATLPA